MSAGHVTDETTSKFLDIVHAKHPLRDDVREMLIEFGAPPGPECIQPYELAEATFEELPTDRREHASTCERCRVVATPASPKFVQQAAREAKRVRQTARPPVPAAPAAAYAASPATSTSAKRSLNWWFFGPIITLCGATVAFIASRVRKPVDAETAASPRNAPIIG